MDFMTSEISTALDSDSKADSSDLFILFIYRTVHSKSWFCNNNNNINIINNNNNNNMLHYMILEVPTVLFCSIVGVKWLVYAYTVTIS